MAKICHLHFRPFVSPKQTTSPEQLPLQSLNTGEKVCQDHPSQSPPGSHAQHESCTFTVSHEVASEFLLITLFSSFLHTKRSHQDTVPVAATVEASAANWKPGKFFPDDPSCLTVLTMVQESSGGKKTPNNKPTVSVLPTSKLISRLQRKVKAGGPSELPSVSLETGA